MEANTTNVLSIASIITSVLGAIYIYMKHSKCHAKCCGKEMDVSVDLTPVADQSLEKIKTIV